MGTSSGEHKMGSMDISQHKSTYSGFIKLTTWSCILLAITLALMAKFLVD
ncbi:aa3-type cytochrome c oxidase subunit IV [Ferrovibrio sp.]|nr:aa3-type cytochrome c oxidase subunit IV [Ferrovibrio sp.]MBP7063808.1 aa3-type cytochrome c oxidase subunit IV [Ferrovibrio sp.]